MGSNWLTSVRKNHAVEHATISILGRNLDKYGQFGGSSNGNGYYIFGPATKENILDASTEAIGRLNLGEHQLAISPFCGTNFLLGGAVATLTTGAILGKKNRVVKSCNAAYSIPPPNINPMMRSHIITFPNLPFKIYRKYYFMIRISGFFLNIRHS